MSKALKVRGGAVPNLWESYLTALDETPLVAKCSTSFVGFCIGDVLAQKAIEKQANFDLKRLIRIASFGFFIHGSTGHYFYNFLDSKIPGTDVASVAAKVAIDQTLWAPIFMTMFFTYFGLFDLNPGSIIPSIKEKMFTSVSTSWKTWIPAHGINFAFVPTKLRLFYINVIQIGFNCFLSIIGNKKVA